MGQFENPFIFALQDPDTSEYYYLDPGTNLPATDPAFTPLVDEFFGDPQAPEGWRDVKISWARSPQYWGLFRNFSTGFKFHGDAAEILTYLFFTQGSTAKCRLIIKKLDDATVSSTVQYLDFYIGDLDFYKCIVGSGYVEIPVKEMGLRDLFFQNERVTYNIPITGGEVVTAAMDGIKLEGKMNFAAGGSSFVYDTQTNVTMPVAFSAQDGDFEIGKDQTTHFALSGNPITTEDWFFKASLTQTVTLSYDFDFGFDYTNSIPGDDGDFVLEFIVFSDDTCTTIINTVSVFTLNGVTPPAIIGSTNQSGSSTFTLVQGNVIVLNFFCNNVSSTTITGGTVDISSGTIDISSVFQLPLSTCTGFREHTVMDKTVEAMTGGLYSADLTFLLGTTALVDSKPYHTIYAPGDSIRGVANPVLKIVPADFFDNIIKDYGGGVGIENDELIFREKSYFLDPSNEIIDLGEVREFTASVAEEYINNVVEAGCNEQEYDNLNGKNEYMNRSQWKTALTFPQVIDLVRPYRYDVYGIEVARYNLFKKDTTDNEVDNDIFVWEFDPLTSLGGGFLPKRDQNAGGGNFATGVLFPDTMYNLSKTSARVCERNGDFLRGMLYYHSSTDLVFQSTQKNSALESDLGFGTITEGADRAVNTLGGGSVAPLFIPNWLKFKCPTGTTLLDAVNANPNGYIKFSVKGIILLGFPWRIDLNGAKKMENEVVLLGHPDVDPMDIREAVKRAQILP